MRSGRPREEVGIQATATAILGRRFLVGNARTGLPAPMKFSPQRRECRRVPRRGYRKSGRMNRPASPVSFSIAPAPRMTERVLARMHRVIGTQVFSDTEQANAFLQSPEFKHGMENPPAPANPLELAQEAAYDAWEMAKPDRYEQARRALAIDDRCSDAWLILAEEERTWGKQRRCLERAVATAERAAQTEGWIGSRSAVESDNLYGHLPARSFFRAKVALARFLMDGSYLRDARVIYEELLRRDSSDHMGVRYEVMEIYHLDEDHAALRQLLGGYREDMTAFLSYERVWLGIVEDIDVRTLRKLTRQALQSNPHVPAYLLGLRDMPDGESGSVAVGGEDEAAVYASIAIDWWMATPETLPWLVANARREEAGLTSSGMRRARRKSRPQPKP